MHGLGNDFVIFDARHDQLSLSPDQIKAIADRHTGVGCDQILVMEPPTHPADIWMKIYNADGTEAEMCGNGLRCVAGLLMAETAKDTCKIQVMEDVIDCEKVSDTEVKVDMGFPTPVREIDLEIEGLPPCFSTTIGNPHAVFFVDDLSKVDVQKIGRTIEMHPEFLPKRTNVEFVQILDNHTLQLKIWERGAGLTAACGSGATAAGWMSYETGRTTPKVQVQMDGGAVTIETLGDEAVLKTGPIAHVFEGEIAV